MPRSIVAVHGLNGDWRDTWLEKETDNMWLEHFLPSAIPKARTMSYGYNSSLALSRSRAGIDEFALNLLNKLIMKRSIKVCTTSIIGIGVP